MLFRNAWLNGPLRRFANFFRSQEAFFTGMGLTQMAHINRNDVPADGLPSGAMRAAWSYRFLRASQCLGCLCRRGWLSSMVRSSISSTGGDGDGGLRLIAGGAGFDVTGRNPRGIFLTFWKNTSKPSPLG